MAVIRKDIYLLGTAISTAIENAWYPTASFSAKSRYYPSYYDPLTAIYFEATLSVAGLGSGGGEGDTALVRLVDAQTGNTITELTTYSNGYVRLRSSDIVSSLNTNSYYDLYVEVYFTVFGGTGSVSAYTSRLIIYQAGTIKKTATYYMVGAYDTFTFVDAGEETVYPKSTVYTSSEFDGTIGQEFQATGLKLGGSSAYLELYDITNSTIRSKLSYSSSSATLAVDVDALNQSAVPTGAEVTTYFDADNVGDYVAMYNAQFVITQTSSTAITKTVNCQTIAAFNFFSESDTAYDSAERLEGNFDPANYTGCSIDSKHEATIKIIIGGYTGYHKLIHGTTTITLSEVSTTSTSYERKLSRSLTEPTTSNNVSMDAYISNSLALATYISSSRLLVYLTNITAEGTNMQVNIGDVWKSVDSLQVNISDVWKPVTNAYMQIAGSWKTIF